MTERERLLALLYDINDEVDFASESALIDDGLINSLEITILVSAIDDAFDVHISVADLEPENFNTVDAMLELIARKRGGK